MLGYFAKLAEPFILAAAAVFLLAKLKRTMGNLICKEAARLTHNEDQDRFLAVICKI